MKVGDKVVLTKCVENPYTEVTSKLQFGLSAYNPHQFLRNRIEEGFDVDSVYEIIHIENEEFNVCPVYILSTRPYETRWFEFEIKPARLLYNIETGETYYE